MVVGVGNAVHALPAPAPPLSPPKAGPSTSPTPNGATLPFGSPILFVLDDPVNSGSTPTGTTIRMHLRAPLVVNGITLAPAGAPGSFSVVSTRKAQSGDIDGAVQIYVNPLVLPSRHLSLPLRAIHEYLSRELTGGQEATRMTTDTVTDVFVPYAILYQALRKGHQMVMPVGTILRAETDATIDATNPANVVLATPPPFVSNYDPPHSDLTPAPFFTPPPTLPHPLRHGKPTLPPRSPSPAPAVSGSGAPAVVGSPAVATSPGIAASPGIGSSPGIAASPGVGASPSTAATPPVVASPSISAPQPSPAATGS